MLCENPYATASTARTCGRCDLCKSRLRRTWAHRIELEARSHAQNAFFTLTYAEEHLPRNIDGNATLAPEDMQLFWKRFRKALSDPKRRPYDSASAIRVFYVGEYGDENFRPHYHAAVFGYPNCRNGRTDNLAARCCDICELVRTTWGKGRIEVGTVEEGSAQYVSGYVTKKMTRYDDPRLQGRMPEFSRQSNKAGGLGYKIAEATAHELVRLGLHTELDDAPTTLRHGKIEKPLGRYLRQRMRNVMWGTTDAPEETKQAAQAELHALLKNQGIDPETLSRLPGDVRRTVIKNEVKDASAQPALNLKARQQRKRKRTL